MGFYLNIPIFYFPVHEMLFIIIRILWFYIDRAILQQTIKLYNF